MNFWSEKKTNLILSQDTNCHSHPHLVTLARDFYRRGVGSCEGMDSNEARGRGFRSPDQQEPPTLKNLLSTIINEIQLVTSGSEETIRGGISRREVETSTLKKWSAKLQAAYDAPLDAPKTILSRILANTEDIKKQVSTKAQPVATSWSQIAASSPPTSPPATCALNPSQTVETKRKELKITIKNQQEKENTEKRSIQDIITAIRSREPKEATKEVIAARRLPSGDLLISTLTESSRITLEKNKDWLRTIASSAEVLGTTFSVFVHGVRVQGVNTNDQLHAITDICKDNRLLHPDLEISRIAWPKKVLLDAKRYSSLILETASPETANRIITHGLIHEGEIKSCVRYITEARVTRCHNCQRYGHIMRFCRNNTICSECAGSHRAEHCTKGPQTSRKCAACKGAHRAGSQSCEIERKERLRAEYTRNHASPLYQCMATGSPNQPGPMGLPASEPQASQTSTNGWRIIAATKRGRPTRISQAARDPNQSRLVTNPLGKRKERDFTPPSPVNRVVRSQSQPPSESQNSVASFDMNEEL